MTTHNHTKQIKDIEGLLPQTQCGLCDTPGCAPYAKAIVEEGAPIDRCLPGGTIVLKKIADYLNVDPTPFLNEMTQKQKPPMLAIIDEDQCIGCTKCIQACPVDAIVGRAKHMHTVLNTECTGCELCVAPCPVDCIDMKILPEPTYDKTLAKTRFEARNARLAKHAQTRKQAYEKAKNALQPEKNISPMQAKRDYIAEAMARVKQKREGKK